MSQRERYAVYFAPRPGTPLHVFGCSVLGRDAETDTRIDLDPALEAAWPDWRSLARAATHYGFHATLKAPFVLADGADRTRLSNDVAALAARLPRIELGRLEVAPMGAFVALVPVVPPAPLTDLAASVVRSLDHLRAPLTFEDRERRKPAALSSRQRDYLEHWGYPYVLEEFRFHMTLSGALSKAAQDRAVALLAELYQAFDETIAIEDICVFAQRDRASAFRLIERHALKG